MPTLVYIDWLLLHNLVFFILHSPNFISLTGRDGIEYLSYTDYCRKDRLGGWFAMTSSSVMQCHAPKTLCKCSLMVLKQ